MKKKQEYNTLTKLSCSIILVILILLTTISINKGYAINIVLGMFCIVIWSKITYIAFTTKNDRK